MAVGGRGDDSRGGGGALRVLLKEREELLAEGVRVRTRGFMLDPKGEGVEPCDAN